MIWHAPPPPRNRKTMMMFRDLTCRKFLGGIHQCLLWNQIIGPHDGSPKGIEPGPTVDGKNPAPLMMSEMLFYTNVKTVSGITSGARFFSINRIINRNT